ncbi:hypothetical protein Tco_0205380 [Tanacetum coccineum]
MTRTSRVYGSTSYEVSVSAEGVEELKRKVKIKDEKKEAILTLRQKSVQKIVHLCLDQEDIPEAFSCFYASFDTKANGEITEEGHLEGPYYAYKRTHLQAVEAGKKQSIIAELQHEELRQYTTRQQKTNFTFKA